MPKQNPDDLSKSHQLIEALTQSEIARFITDEDRKCFSLTTSFTMKTAAQYKVVDRISKEFKFWTFDLEGYREMIISFPSHVGRVADE